MKTVQKQYKNSTKTVQKQYKNSTKTVQKQLIIFQMFEEDYLKNYGL